MFHFVGDSAGHVNSGVPIHAPANEDMLRGSGGTGYYLYMIIAHGYHVYRLWLLRIVSVHGYDFWLPLLVTDSGSRSCAHVYRFWLPLAVTASGYRFRSSLLVTSHNYC